MFRRVDIRLVIATHRATARVVRCECEHRTSVRHAPLCRHTATRVATRVCPSHLPLHNSAHDWQRQRGARQAAATAAATATALLHTPRRRGGLNWHPLVPAKSRRSFRRSFRQPLRVQLSAYMLSLAVRIFRLLQSRREHRARQSLRAECGNGTCASENANQCVCNTTSAQPGIRKVWKAQQLRLKRR